MTKKRVRGVLTTVILVLGAQVVGGQEVPPEPAEVANAGEPGPEAPDEVQAEETQEQQDPCAARPGTDTVWVDKLNAGVYSTVCGSARWFDRFFGNERSFEDANTTYGLAGLNFIWSEYVKLKVRGDFRAKVSLPNMENKLHLVVGWVPVDIFENEMLEGGDPLPGMWAGADENELIVGLGYTPLSDSSKLFRISAGVRVSWPLDPYVKGRFRYRQILTENQSLEYRPTLFWYREDGFGINLQVDYDNRFSRRFVGRWTTSGTYSETTLGVLWWSSVSLYQALEETRGAALLYKIWVNGETEAPVDLTDYGLYLLYRQRMWRDWFYVEAGPGIHWPREEIDEVREASLGAIVGFDFRFGREP